VTDGRAYHASCQVDHIIIYYGGITSNSQVLFDICVFNTDSYAFTKLNNGKSFMDSRDYLI
jgi:hypothetical protein